MMENLCNVPIRVIEGRGPFFFFFAFSFFLPPPSLFHRGIANQRQRQPRPKKSFKETSPRTYFMAYRIFPSDKGGDKAADNNVKRRCSRRISGVENIVQERLFWLTELRDLSEN